MYWKYFEKEEKLLIMSNFSSYPQIFCYQLLDCHVKTGTRFLPRDKRLFEITEVEITRADCINSPRVIAHLNQNDIENLILCV